VFFLQLTLTLASVPICLPHKHLQLPWSEPKRCRRFRSS